MKTTEIAIGAMMFRFYAKCGGRVAWAFFVGKQRLKVFEAARH